MYYPPSPRSHRIDPLAPYSIPQVSGWPFSREGHCRVKELLGNIWEPQNTVRCQKDKVIIDQIDGHETPELEGPLPSWDAHVSRDGEIQFRMDSTALMDGGQASAFCSSTR